MPAPRATTTRAAVEEHVHARALQRDAAFRTAALGDDRVALRAAVRALAAALGTTSEQLLVDYAMTAIVGLATQYDLEVGAGVDRAALVRMGEAFQLDLALKCAQLALHDVM